jgi:cell division protein FtsB
MNREYRIEEGNRPMDKEAKGGRRYWRIALVVFLLIFFLSLFDSRGLLGLYRLYRTEQHLRAQIEERKAKNAALKEEASRWQEDLGRIERVARDELGLVKPGELVYQF